MICCIGHSHAAAVAEAGAKRGLEIDALLFWSQAGLLREDGRLTAPAEDRIRRADRVVASIGGGAYTSVALVEHHRPFDFVLPSEPDLPLDAARELVPAEGLRAAIAQREAAFADVLRQIQALRREPVIQLEPPPSVQDSAVIAGAVPWDLWPGQPRAVSPPGVRYKAWRLNCEIIAERCAAAGADYLAVPAAALDGAGFLRADLSADGIHGAPEYGLMVWDEIAR